MNKKLRDAKNYDRIAGYFCSSILEIAGETIEAVCGTVRVVCSSNLSKEDVAFVHKALVYAVECHSGQYRKSGEPYIIHPIQVAGILAKLKLDAVTVACGFLHDVVEASDTTEPLN